MISLYHGEGGLCLEMAKLESQNIWTAPYTFQPLVFNAVNVFNITQKKFNSYSNINLIQFHSFRNQ
jgi:hypothetical protein